MKKLLFIAAAFLVAAPMFAQTKKTEKKATDTKTVKTTTVAPKKEVKTASNKPAKPAASAIKAIDVSKENVVLEKEAIDIVPTQIAPATPPAAPVDVNKLFEFKNDAFDFGKIPAGKPAKYDLFIKNISKETATLTLVQPGCGCTTPEYEKDKKFAPGETVKVTLGFNGGGATGSGFSKSVTVTLNGNATKVVTFRGETFTVPTESAPANGAIDKLKPAEAAKP